MTDKAAKKIVHLFIGGLVLILLLTGVVFLQSFLGRKSLENAERDARYALVDAQRGSCERAKLDRRASALGWRTAQNARMASLSEQLDIPLKGIVNLLPQPPKPDDPFDLTAARLYDKIALELEERSEIDCAKAFPKES